MNRELIKEVISYLNNSSVALDRASNNLAWMINDKNIGLEVQGINFNINQTKARLEEDIKLLHVLLEKEKS